MKFNLTIPRKILGRKRDDIRLMGYHLREPISAELKKDALRMAHNECQWKDCKENEFLDFHHKDMVNDHNTLSNIEVLCPTHHRKKHKLYKKVVTKRNERQVVESEVMRKDKIKKIKPKNIWEEIG